MTIPSAAAIKASVRTTSATIHPWEVSAKKVKNNKTATIFSLLINFTPNPIYYLGELVKLDANSIASKSNGKSTIKTLFPNITILNYTIISSP